MSQMRMCNPSKGLDEPEEKASALGSDAQFAMRKENTSALGGGWLALNNGYCDKHQ